ncbi:MAG: IS110 family transposase [Bacteroidota bacterium]
MSKKNPRVIIIKQNVGIDISKDDFKVFFYRLTQTGESKVRGSRAFKNTSVGFVAFDKWIEKNRKADLPVRFTLEATGIYHENLAHFLENKGHHVSIVLANQAKAYAKSLNLKSKTDAMDAKMLGQMGLERDLQQWKPISPKLRIIKQLTRDRVSLLEEQLALTNKLHALDHSFEPNKRVIKRMKQRLKLIEKHIEQSDQEIQQTVQADEVLKTKIAKVCKIKGLALITVATIVAETNGFALFTSRAQLTSYAGYDVVERQSGSSIKGKTKISKKGNRFIRRALHLPALSMVQHEPQFRQLYERVFERTGIKMKGYVAVQRKALLLIYTLFKNDLEYNPNFQNQPEEIKESVIQISRQDTSPAYTG